jgi:hypothetical protein
MVWPIMGKQSRNLRLRRLSSQRGELLISAQNARFQFVPALADVKVRSNTLPWGRNDVKQGPFRGRLCSGGLPAVAGL